MGNPVFVDAGPIVALINRDDAHHAWARAQFSHCPVPLLTCDAVLSESFFLLRQAAGGVATLIALLRRGAVVSQFDLAANMEPVTALMEKCADVPMSLADACLVRLSELHAGARVFTLDSDFRLYRRHGRQAIPLVAP